VAPGENEMCKICEGVSDLFDTETVLGKYDVKYFRCPQCGLIETEAPYWLGEAYSEAIVQSDVGLVGRNIGLVQPARMVIGVFFDSAGRFVDYGGGYGLFVRLMRDAGFDFRRYDRYCPNLFAKGLDVVPDENERFDLLTAFEVFEHLVDPVKELDLMVAMSSNILFTTRLIPMRNPPRPKDWWYYAVDGGQHITLYTRESLSSLAKKKGLNFYSVGELHLLTKETLSPLMFRLLVSGKAACLARFLAPGRRSLSPDDYYRLTGKTPC
jgi:hypothetical protein